MTKLKRQPVVPPPLADLGLWTLEELGGRWKVHPEIARRKCRQVGIPAIRISQKVVRYRIADILRFETECSTTEPTAGQLAKVDAMNKAKREAGK